MTEQDSKNKPESPNSKPEPGTDDTAARTTERPREIGGRKGPDPTRYGDWEKAGRCIDF
jgi:hypothetical protein